MLGSGPPPTVLPASVTPFNEKGQVDHPGVARLLAWFRSEGCDGVVLAGTNGEGPSLSAVERRDLVRTAVPLAHGMPVILGVATPSLEEAIWLCRQAHSAGATAALVMPPAYFREAPEAGLVAWFEAVLERSSVPILLYNFPKRTGITLSPELVRRLAGHEAMHGLKDSSGDRGNLQAYAQAAPGKLLYVGDETLLIEAIDAGWTGTISGAANVLGRWLAQIVGELKTDRESAETKFALLAPVLEAVRKSPQPGSHKAILQALGVMDDSRMRLPLLSPEAAEVRPAMDAVLPLIRPS